MGWEQERKYFTFQVQRQWGTQNTAVLIRREQCCEPAAGKEGSDLQKSLNFCSFFICKTKGCTRLTDEF